MCPGSWPAVYRCGQHVSQPQPYKNRFSVKKMLSKSDGSMKIMGLEKTHEKTKAHEINKNIITCLP